MANLAPGGEDRVERSGRGGGEEEEEEEEEEGTVSDRGNLVQEGFRCCDRTI
jgi:hypothetical protein